MSLVADDARHWTIAEQLLAPLRCHIEQAFARDARRSTCATWCRELRPVVEDAASAAQKS